MIPSHYVCTSCAEEFDFEHRDAVYYFGTAPLGDQLLATEVLPVPVRPGWCKTCARLCLVEDIKSLRTFEGAYAAVRAGQVVEYPTETMNFDASQAQDLIGTYLRWRMKRVHSSRALCCGGANYQYLDIPQPLLKHSECDFGVVEAQYLLPGSYNGPGPGVYSPANIRVFDSEGLLVGLLTTLSVGSMLWNVVPAAYELLRPD